MTVPDIITLTYQTKQFHGLANEPHVFDCLVTPPTTGVAAQTASDAAAHAVGTVLSPNPALLDRTRQRDGMMDFYDSASILRPSS